jgi:uncharacterized protein
MLKSSFKSVFYLFVFTAFLNATAGSYDNFFAAVSRDDVAAIEALFGRGFDPNARNPQGQPALTAAIQAQSMAVAGAILRHPALDVDAENKAGETALMIAALKGDAAMAQRLLERGARIQRPGWSPVHYAAAAPTPAVLALLLDRGASPDVDSPNRTTPLMMAARYGSEAAVRLLLARGADPKRRNELGLGAADFASDAGRQALAQELTAIGR